MYCSVEISLNGLPLKVNSLLEGHTHLMRIRLTFSAYVLNADSIAHELLSNHADL